MEKISISADVKKAWLEKMPELQKVLDQDAQAIASPKGASKGAYGGEEWEAIVLIDNFM